MNKKNREITDQKKIREILKNGQVINIAFHDDLFPYVLPFNYGVEFRNQKIYLYFHSAQQGKKIELMAKNPQVAFSLVTKAQLAESEIAHKCTMHYESVCGTGFVEKVIFSEKKKALDILMQNYSVKKNFSYPAKIIEKTYLWRIRVESLTAKSNINAINNDV